MRKLLKPFALFVFLTVVLLAFWMFRDRQRSLSDREDINVTVPEVNALDWQNPASSNYDSARAEEECGEECK